MQARRRLNPDADAIQVTVPGLDSMSPSPLMTPSMAPGLFSDSQLFFAQSPALQRVYQTDQETRRVSLASLGSLKELVDLAELGSPLKFESPRSPYDVQSLSSSPRGSEFVPPPRTPPFSRLRHSTPPVAFTTSPDLPAEVTCSLCFESMFSIDGVKLVCSHQCHMRCLRTEISDGELPSCGVCQYTAKPQNIEDFAKIEHLVTRRPLPPVLANIGTVITGIDDDSDSDESSTTESDEASTDSDHDERLQSTIFAHASRRRSQSSSVFGSEPGTPVAQLIGEVEPEPRIYATGEVLTPWEGANAPIDVDLQFDPLVGGSASCIVSVSSPADAFTVEKYTPSPEDHKIAHDTALEVYETAAFQGVGLDAKVTGRLRLTCQFAMSEDRLQWDRVVGYLFERALIICTYGSTGEELKNALDLSDDDLRTSLWMGDDQPVLRLDSNILGTPVFLKSIVNSDITAVHWQAALRDSSLYFPLTPNSQVLERFASQYAERPTQNIVVCTSSDMLFQVGTAVLRRLSSFDRVSFVLYDCGLVVGPHRSVWSHWTEAVANPKLYAYPAANEIPLAAAFQLVPSAVIFVANATADLSVGAEPKSPQIFPCPVHCISLAGANESLSQLAGKSGGSFSFAQTAREAAECAEGVTAAERCVTHVSTCLSIVPTHSWTSNVVGWQRGPRLETYRNPQPYDLDHPRSHGVGGFVVDFGRLYAGGSFSLWIDLESESTTEPIVEITACGLSSSNASKLVRTRKHVAVPVNVTDTASNAEINFWKLAHNAADSIERVLTLANHANASQAVATCAKVVKELEEARQEMSRIEMSPQLTESELARDMAIGRSILLIDGLMDVLFSVKTDASQTLPSQVEGRLLECLWTLRQRQAFTRRNSIDALFSESLETNVI